MGLWDLGSEEAKPLHTLDSGDEINALSFSPNRYWLCAAAGAVIKIWDLEQKVIVEELKPEVMGHKEGSPPVCTSLCWSSDGQTLFAGSYVSGTRPVRRQRKVGDISTVHPCASGASINHDLHVIVQERHLDSGRVADTEVGPLLEISHVGVATHDRRVHVVHTAG